MLHGVRSLPEESAQPHARTLDPTDVLLSEWLSQHPEKDLAPVALAARVAHLSHVLRQRIEKPLDRFGLDWGLFMVLVALRGAGRPFRMSPHELHRLLLLSPAAVTNRLYRLQLKGLVDRITDPTDRRSVPVVLTPQGQSTVDRAMAACVEADVGLQDDRAGRSRRHDQDRAPAARRPGPTHGTHPGARQIAQRSPATGAAGAGRSAGGTGAGGTFHVARVEPRARTPATAAGTASL